MVQSKVAFNTGIFTPAEVALYAKLHPSTVQRWFFGSRMGRPVLPRKDAQEKVLGFLDFVQAVAIRTIRRERSVPLQKIREAVVRAETDYKLTNIFARPHCTVLFDGDIHIYPKGCDAPVQITGKRPNQMGLRPIVEPYQRDLAFDAHGLARLFTAYKFADQSVIIDPAVRFGEPYVLSCGYSARTFYDAVLSEGGITEAAKAFDVPPQAVEAAYRYYDSLPIAA